VPGLIKILSKNANNLKKGVHLVFIGTIIGILLSVPLAKAGVISVSHQSISNIEVNHLNQFSAVISTTGILQEYTFSWNASGSWVNDTAVSIGGVSYDFVDTHTNPATADLKVSWRLYVSDNVADYQGPIQSFVTHPAEIPQNIIIMLITWGILVAFSYSFMKYPLLAIASVYGFYLAYVLYDYSLMYAMVLIFVNLYYIYEALDNWDHE